MDWKKLILSHKRQKSWRLAPTKRSLSKACWRMDRPARLGPARLGSAQRTLHFFSAFRADETIIFFVRSRRVGYASRTQDVSWGASRRHVSKVGRSRRRNDHFRNFHNPGFVFSDTFFHGVKSCAQAWELSTIFNIRSAPGPPPPLPPHPAPSPPLPQGVLPGALVEFLGVLLGIRLRGRRHAFCDTVAQL